MKLTPLPQPLSPARKGEGLKDKTNTNYCMPFILLKDCDL